MRVLLLLLVFATFMFWGCASSSKTNNTRIESYKIQVEKCRMTLQNGIPSGQVLVFGKYNFVIDSSDVTLNSGIEFEGVQDIYILDSESHFCFLLPVENTIRIEKIYSKSWTKNVNGKYITITKGKKPIIYIGDIKFNWIRKKGLSLNFGYQNANINIPVKESKEEVGFSVKKNLKKTKKIIKEVLNIEAGIETALLFSI